MIIEFEEIKQHTDHSPGFDYLFKMMSQRAISTPEGIPFLEFGVRAGGSAMLALWAIKESGIQRPMITVDPYGDKSWKAADNRIIENDGYGEDYFRQTQNLLTDFCVNNKLDWWHYRMTDVDFMKIWDDLEVWYQGKRLKKQFGFVYLDAEHAPDVILREYEWAKDRMFPGGMISIDDIIVDYENTYTHDGVNRSYIGF